MVRLDLISNRAIRLSCLVVSKEPGNDVMEFTIGEILTGGFLAWLLVTALKYFIRIVHGLVNLGIDDED